VGRDQIALFLRLANRQALFRKIRKRSRSAIPRPPLSQDRTRRNQFPDSHGLQATRFRGAVNTALDQFCADPVRLPRRGTRKSGLTGRHCPIAITPVNDAGTVAGHRARPLAAGPVAQWLEPAAHNGLVAGSSPAGPTNDFNLLSQHSNGGILYAHTRLAASSKQRL
jgi:hypothetical protein